MTRRAWGARPAKGRPRVATDELRGVAVHYTGMNADEQRLHANCAARIRAIQAFHIDGQGWLDIAYNHLFCHHGFVFAGRGFGVRSAANGTAASNDAYLAICFLGNDSARRADITPQAFGALRALVGEYRRRYPGARRIRPHSDFFATACPGDELRALIEGL